MFHSGKFNAKLEKHAGLYTFSLPAGWTCPGAQQCLSRADKTTGSLMDGQNMKFRCFSASAESSYSRVRRYRWVNLEKVRAALKVNRLADLLAENLPARAEVVRVHVSGDMFSREYLEGWIGLAKMRPECLFYGYTKSAHLCADWESWPSNMTFVYSMGGKFDHLALSLGMRLAHVVFTRDEASNRGLAIDHDDSLAMNPTVREFALLLHGCQKKGSNASAALSDLKRSGEKGYSRANKPDDLLSLGVIDRSPTLVGVKR